MAPVDFSLDNPNLVNFGFYSIITLGKMAGLTFLTGYRRKKRKIFANPEDLHFFVDKNTDASKLKPILNDEDVERTRRNHLNDVENIPMHIFVGFFYVLTNPDPLVALWHFRTFCASRFLHMLCYQLGLQPWRGVAHVVGLATTVSMGVQFVKAVCF